MYKDCADLYRAGIRRSGVYTINPDKRGAFKVYCDQVTAGGGWTVIQKRFDGAVDFYRGWHDYKVGFGNKNGEYWLGLDKINRWEFDSIFLFSSYSIYLFSLPVMQAIQAISCSNFLHPYKPTRSLSFSTLNLLTLPKSCTKSFEDRS